MAAPFDQGFRERLDLRLLEKDFAEFEAFHFSKTLIALLGVDRPNRQQKMRKVLKTLSLDKCSRN